MDNNNMPYIPSDGEDANRICEELALFNNKKPNFLKEVPADFIKRIAEILGQMRV